MPEADRQEETLQTPLARAKHLVLKVLGARRVAGWCGLDELSVYKWFERGTDAAPIPANHVPTIVAAAKAEGLDAPLAVLWPAMAGVGS